MIDSPRTPKYSLSEMTILFFYLVIQILSIALERSSTHALELHLRTNQEYGASVFNASSGSGWQYSFDRRRSTLQVETLLHIDNTGQVTLLMTPDCTKIVHNPFMVYINSRNSDNLGYANYTILPMRVYLHGQNCFIKYKRKSVVSTPMISNSLSRTDRSNVIMISIQLEEQFGVCLPKDFTVLSLYNYLPKSVSNCVMNRGYVDSADFYVDIVTGELKSSNMLCLNWPSRILFINLDTAFCGALSLEPNVPIEIVLYPKEFPTKSSVVEEYMARVAPHRRLKRGTVNTPPSFSQRLYVENVPEEKNPGYIINTITADDPDSGDEGRITYSLLATKDGRSQNMFGIDPTSGRLSITQRLDREKIPVHYFLITAMDHGRPSQSGTASLTVYVDDINDHAPQFESATYHRPISESISVGATVLTVRANDEDSGSNAEVEYSIMNPSGENEVFRIEPRLGSIVVRQHLDRERQDSYSLEIQATDKALITERKTATAVVEITIEDENDNRPQFSRSSYMVNVSEDIDPSGNPVIAEIQATDDDAGDNGMVRYSITSGNLLNTFSIDPVTGQLSVLQPLDYEKMQMYRISVRARDNGSPYKSNSTMVLIKVIDVNDNDPKFYMSLYPESVYENEPVGYTIMRVQAFDSDSSLNSALIYTLQHTPDDLPFIMDPVTGVLMISQALDREVTTNYDFSVEARDQGSPVRSASARIQIHIRDVNDNAPVFDPRVYSEVVSEEAYPGTPVLAVTARDRDENTRVVYEIQDGNVNGAFSIDSQMGQGLIRVSRLLNYQEHSRYVLTVKATDGHLFDTATIFINITDANTYRPEFQGAPYQVHVEEDKPIGSSIYKVYATDNDVNENARITYQMNDNEAFQIDPVTGEIIIKHMLNREAVSGYTISITATDHGRPPQSDSTDIEITIIDVNDNAPKFPDLEYLASVEEDAFVGTSVLTIRAQDADVGLNGRLRYTFEGGDSGEGDFRLDPVLGILRVNKELDRERNSHYELVAYAVDRGTPEQSTSVLIGIQINDINDNAPQFQASNLDMFIPENSPIGSTVGMVSAIDPDEGVNAEIKYSIMGNLDGEDFQLSYRPYEAAIITTAIELDYEGSRREYAITVRARSFHLFSETKIMIHVQDANDNMPQLNDFIIIFNNYKDHFPTGEIGRIPAHDPDEDDRLTYTFVSGNQANIIHLDKSTGMIRLDPRLNSDVPTNATLQVRVHDGINEVKRTCRLFVRLVTEEMLTNSTTVRLNNIDHKTFLSIPLYDMFVSALASIIPTSEDNIFMINVQDDTDVDAKILNVSFAIRSKLVNNEDIFYDSQFLREKVYLQRALLAKLSTLEILRFDDNLCLIEPCFNFDQCSVIQKFGNTSGFVGSDTMLFRPIHPTNQFMCSCPQGFTGMSRGYLCDAEVNLCYSNPCGNNGTCKPHEGGYTCHCNKGFTGDHCAIDTSSVDACPLGICKHGARCVPLIRGGFRCEECPLVEMTSDLECQDCRDIEHRDEFCGLRTRSFERGSFLMFASLKRRHQFTIRLSFATREKNGLLFYNGRYNEQHDFVALEIVNGKVQFAFSLGSMVTRVQASIQGGVNDGNWHEITVHYYNKTATLKVGSDCDTELSIRYGSDLGDHCAATATQILEERCSDPLQFCHRFLDLTGLLQIGGLPSLHTDFQVQNTEFVGCIRDVYIDESILDLDDHVYNYRTETGCRNKRSFCKNSLCKNEGVCRETWGDYSCQCPDGWGGKDCSQHIENPSYLSGSSYLLFDDLSTVTPQLWVNGIAFRTRQMAARLLTIELGEGTRGNPVEGVYVDIVDGYVVYIHPEKTMTLDDVMINDGVWHYLEVRWTNKPQQIMLTLDYGQVKRVSNVGNYLTSKLVNSVYVGGQVDMTGSSPVIRNGFKGCVKDIRVGNTDVSVLSRPDKLNVITGCSVDDPCDDDPCPVLTSTCTSLFGDHKCSCNWGHKGARCERICDRYNPCTNSSQCRQLASSSSGYVCECPSNYEGTYCERRVIKECPSEWWGQPICGPCNCPIERGFDSNCNKQTGECTCREHHYRPGGGDTCYPCDCYSVGSLQPSCDLETGQCKCKDRVVGRRCDQCSTKFAEVTIRGCEMQYEDCPRSIHNGVWWGRTPLDQTAVHDCPEGAFGQAIRVCDGRESWLEPDYSECVSDMFVSLRDQLKHLEGKSLEMNAYLARTLVTEMDRATGSVDRLFLNDLNVTYAVLVHVLSYECQQTGLSLTHKQDRNFIQNIVSTTSRILDLKNRAQWLHINGNYSGTVELLYFLEKYSITLAKNMHQLFMQPFDVVHDNVVLGLDTVVATNQTNITIPKYNNKVRHPDLFDDSTSFTIPMSMIKSQAETETLEGQPGTIVSYVMFKTLGDLLPQKYSSDVRIINNISLSINTPVFTVNVVSDHQVVQASQPTPVHVTFQELTTQKRTSPQCVYWKYIQKHGLFSGKWSSSGCELVSRVPEDVLTCDQSQNCTYQTREYVTCRCDHMTSFAVIMDVSTTEYSFVSIDIQLVTYICLAISLACLTVAFIMFCCLKGLNSNMNSIHINLALSLLIVQLIFLVGINRVQPEIACRLVAILLNYFYLSSFFWMFVETLHLYRIITEVRDIDVGAMKFYYLLGYVIPGIIVGLAVGLKTDQFGNNVFCWLRTDDLIIWSFAGPICFIFGCNVAVYIMALKASCASKKGSPDHSHVKFYLHAGLVLLPLLGIAWVFAILSINENVLVFHYLFAIFTCLQGIFLLLAYVIFCKNTRRQLRYQFHRLRGRKGLDDSLNDTRASMLSRSALAYQNDSLDGGLSRLHVGASGTSSTSRSTSKSSGAFYRPDAYIHTTSSTSTSGNIRSAYDLPPNAGIAPYGWHSDGDPDTGEKRRKRRDSDSDSEMSAVEHPDLELASSHSSDDDEDDQYQWGKDPKRIKSKKKPRLTVSLIPSTSAGPTPQKIPPSPHGYPASPRGYPPSIQKLPPSPRRYPPSTTPSPQKYPPSTAPSPQKYTLSTAHSPQKYASPTAHSPQKYTPSTTPSPQKYAPSTAAAPIPPVYTMHGLTTPPATPPHIVPTPPHSEPTPLYDITTPLHDLATPLHDLMTPPMIPPRHASADNPRLFSAPSPAPPYYHRKTPPKGWPVEAHSTPGSERDAKSPRSPTLCNGSPTENDAKHSDRDRISPPHRTDSLPSPKLNGSANSPKEREGAIKVLTHNGSISESESVSSSSDSSKDEYSWP